MKSVCIVSPFPPYGKKHHNKGGVASYTKMLIENLSQLDGWGCTVLCDYDGEGRREYREGGYRVVRGYSDGLFFWFEILRSLRSIKCDVINIQHEIFLYGGGVNIVLFLIILLVLRFGSCVVTTLHGVVDVDDINSSFVKRYRSSLPPFVVRVGFKILFRLIGRLSGKVVVHEELFKKRLVEKYGVPEASVFVIPHMVEDRKTVGKIEARKRTGISPESAVVLFMGYWAGYKDIGLLLEGVFKYKQINPNCLLVVGAGVHPKFKNDNNYLLEYSMWKDRALELLGENVRWVGFIDERDIVNYYSAADVAVFPYIDAISSSGPMALCFTYRLPFLASSVLSHVAPDFPEIFFENNPDALAHRLDGFFRDRGKFVQAIEEMRGARLPGAVSSSYAYAYMKAMQEN